MHRALPTVTIVLALLAPSLLAAGQVPEPDLETPLAAPTEATGQAVQAALEATDGLLNPAFAVAAAELAAFQAEVLRCTTGSCAPDALPLTQAGVDFATASAAYAAGQALAVADLATIWGASTGESFALLHEYANTTAAVAVDTSTPNDRIVVLEPQGRVAGAPVADLVGGFYRFNLTVVDRTGAPVALGDWRLEVLGLQVLPGQEPLAVPGLAALTKPVATLTLLFAAERDLLNGAVFDTSTCGGQEGCAVLSVPAASLKLERLYAGSQVFVRFLPGSGALPSDVGWHSALVAAAYQASLQEPAVPYVAQLPPQPPLPEEVPSEVRRAYAALAPLFGGSIGDDPAKRSLVAADVLDQFPTAIVLAPGVVDPASPDPDGDGWTTLVELSLNSDPFDPLSRPGVDDDADGIMNYLEASRADAVDWLQGLEPTPTPVPLTRRVPLPGLAIVGNEIPAGALGAGPLPTTLLPADLASRTDIEVLDVGVAGPPEFVLQDLTFERMGGLLAGADAELQNLTLVLDAPEGPRTVAEWAFRAGQWVRVDPGTLTCAPDCGPEAASWTVGLGLDVDDVARFHLYLDVGPRGVDRLTLDGKVFQAVSDSAKATLTSANLPIAVREGNPVGPVQTVDVQATRLVPQSIQFPEAYVAGAAVDVVFQAEDAFTSVDLGFGATSGDDVQFTFADGTGLPSPSGEPAQPDLRVPLKLGATVGTGQVLLPQLRLYHATNPTTVLATDLTGQLLEVQAPSGVLDPEPWGPSKVVLVGVPAELSADATSLSLAAQVTDWYGNPRPFENLVFTFGGLEPDQPVTANGAGLAAFTLATPDANLPRKVAGFTYPIGVGAPAGNGTTQRVVQVVPGALASVVIEGNEGTPLVGPIRRAMRDPGAAPPLLGGPPVAGYQNILLFPRGHDKFGNRIEADVPSLWTAADAALAEALDELPAVQGNTLYPVTSRAGGVSGQVCAQPVAAPTVQGCVPLNFTGLAPPVVTVDGCVPSVNATTGQAFAVCLTIEDDVLSSVGAPVVILRHGGAPLSLPALVRVDLGNAILYQLTLDVPANSLAAYEVSAEVSDWDTEPIEYVDNQEVLLQPVGGDGLAVDITFPVRDGIAPTLNYTFDATQAILRGDTLVVRRATPLDVTATDNIPGAVTTTASLRAAGSAEAAVQDLTTDPRLDLSDLNGVYELTLEAVDGRGLPATPIVLTLVVDEQAPTTKLVVEGVSYSVQRNGEDVLVVPAGTDLTLASLDLPPGGAGVRQTFLDQGGNLVAVGPEDRIALSAGDHLLKFHSQDLLGLESTITTVLVHRDLDGPAVTIGEPGEFVPSRTVEVAFEVRDASPLDAAAVTATVGDIPVVLAPPEPLVGGLKFTGIATVPADAEYNLRVLAADPADKASQGNHTFTVDTVAPVIGITSPAEDALLPLGDLVPAFTVDDLHLPAVSSATCALDDGPFGACAGVALQPAHGPHTLRVKATDLAGNVGIAEQPFEVDAVAPEVTLTLGPDAPVQHNTVFFLNATATDPHLTTLVIEELVDGVYVPIAPEDLTGGLELPYTASRQRVDLTFRARALDAAGNVGTSLPVTTMVDTAEPTAFLDPRVGITFGAVQRLVAGTVPILGQAGEAGDVIEGWLLERQAAGGGFVLLAAGTTTIEGTLAALDTTLVPDGPVTLRLTVTTVGGEVGTATLDLVVDNTAPADVLLAPLEAYQFDPTFTIAASAADAHLATLQVQRRVGEGWVTVPGGDFTTATGSVTFTADPALELVPLRFRAVATDALGRVTESATVETTIDALPIPAVVIVPSLAGGVVPVRGAVGAPGQALQQWVLEVTTDGAVFTPIATGTTAIDGVLASWDTPSLGSPAAQLRIRATSVGGRTFLSELAPVQLDNLPPAVGAIPLSPFQGSRAFEITAAAEDLHGLALLELQQFQQGAWVALGNTTSGTLTRGYTATAAEELVPLQFRAVARDLAGNAAIGPIATTQVDTADPVGVLTPVGLPVGEGLPRLVRGVVPLAGQAGMAGQTIQGWVLETAPDGGAFAPVASGSTVLSGTLASWDTPALPDGVHHLRLTVTTVSGRTAAAPATLAVRVDNTPPVAVLVPPGDFQASRTFDLVVRVEDANLASVELQENVGGQWVTRATFATPEGRFTYTAPGDGARHFRAVARDLVGNAPGISAMNTTFVDTALPIARLDALGNLGVVRGDVAVLGQAGVLGQSIQGWVLDIDRGSGFVELHRQGTPAVGTLTTWKTRDEADGTYRLRLTTSTVGSRSETAQLTVTVDNTPPVVSGLVGDAAHSVPNAWSAVRATSFQYTLSEAVATVECRLVEAALPIPCTATGTAPFDTPDGRHTFRVAVTDRAGNAAAATFRLFVDATPPAVSLDPLPQDIAETERLTIRATVSDPASGIRTVNLRTIVGALQTETPMILRDGAWSATVGPFPQGLVQVQVVARDALNNVQETAPKMVGIRDVTPPVVTVREPSARVHAAAIPVVLDATDAGQGVATVTVELLGRSETRVVVPFTGGLFQLPALSVAGIPNGDYTLSIRVVDRAGNAATVLRSVDVAKVPALNVPSHAAGERTLAVQVVTPDGPGTLALWLYPTVHGEIRGRIQMNRTVNTDLWTATVHDLEPGNLVAYFVEARDGLASTRAPATGAIEAILPIPDVAKLDWNALEKVTEQAQVENPENHLYVNILSGQFTHDGATATFGLKVEGAFPTPAELNGAPVPRYLVEFDTDEDADPEFVLRATYTGEPVPANWVGQGRPADTDVGEPTFNFTVLPGADRTTLGFQVPVPQLVAHVPNIDEAEVRFVARGSLVTTAPKPFDVTAPSLGTPTVPAELDDATPLTLSVPVTDNRDGSDSLSASVELRVNGNLRVVDADVVAGLVVLPPDLAHALPLGTAELVVTTFDKSGNRASTLPITIPVVDRTLPSLGPLGLTLNGKALADPHTVNAGTSLTLQADLRDNAGLATAIARLGGQDLPLNVLDGTLRGTTFQLPAPSMADQGRHTLDLVVTDLTGLRLPFTPVTLQVLDEVPPAITLAVVRAPGAFSPTAPALPALEPGDRAVVSALVLDNLGQVAGVTATVTQGATTCAFPLPAKGGDLFEAPLDCALGLGPVEVVVTATDGQHEAIPATLAFVRQDSAPPTVGVTLRKPDGTLVPLQRGGSVTIRDSDAALHDLLLSIQDAGALDRATVVLEPREQVLANLDLAPAIFSPGEFTRHLPALEAGSYRVVVTALDLVGPGTVRALADAPPFELTLVVADALEPRVAFEPGTPLGGDVTPTNRVTFAGTVLDASGVDPAGLQFTLDGVAATPVLTEVSKSAATGGASGYRFQVAQDLPPGRHEFSLRAADLSGFRVASTWGFYVVEKPVFTPPTIPAVGAVAAPAPSAPPAPVTGATGSVQPLATPPPPPPPEEAALPALPEAGQAEVQFAGGSAVTAVLVTAESALDQARVVARQLPVTEQARHEFGSLHQQFELTVQDASGTVAPAVLDHIDFRVPRSDLAAAGADATGTALLHLEPDGSWAPRATTFLSEDAAFYYYRAEHGGRSTFAIVFDRAPPVVELIAPTVASLTGALPVEAVARDDTAVKDLEVTLDGATIGSGAPLLRLLIDPTTLAQVAQGTVELVAVARDATGKTGRAVQVVLLERSTTDTCLDPASDQQPPVTTVAWRGGDAAVFGDILGIKGPVTGRFTAVDQGPEGCRDSVVPEVRYRVDDGPWLGGLTVDLRADQPHTLEYYAVDRRGNEEAHHTLRVVPAEDADPSAPQPVEPLEAPKRGLPGFEAAFVVVALAALVLARPRGRRGR